MKWIKEHKTFSVITGIVIVLCLFILISFGKGNGGISQGVQWVGSAVGKPFSSATGGIRGFFVGIFTYKDLEKENKNLKEKLEVLEEENKEIKLSKQELEELQGLEKALKFENNQVDGEGVVASVIAIDLSNPYMVFTVDRGTNQGVEVGKVVIDEKGMVGKVIETGGNWSKIISIVNENSNISFKCLREPETTGVLTGDGTQGLTGYLFDEKSKIIKGDLLITSGIGVFPEGITIGEVEEISYDNDSNLKTVTVKPTVKFTSLQRVAIVL